MADFKIAVAKTLKNEGGKAYSENINDRGGPTKFGISLRFYKTLKGNELSTRIDIQNLTQEQAEDIYFQNFWLANRYGEIEDQVIAEKVFDMAVLIGATPSNKILQRSVNIPEKYVDGIIGKLTLRCVNEEPFTLCTIEIFNKLLTEYFLSICNKDKTQSKFLLGWLNRVMS